MLLLGCLRVGCSLLHGHGIGFHLPPLALRPPSGLYPVQNGVGTDLCLLQQLLSLLLLLLGWVTSLDPSCIRPPRLLPLLFQPLATILFNTMA